MANKMMGFVTGFVALVSLVCMVNGFNVDLTILQSAVAKGAVCLDGSPPAYFIDKGTGTGANNWIVHFEGGAWCNDPATCAARKKQKLGSSSFMPKQKAFSGLFGKSESRNPFFYNWNKVRVQYCDGGSFTGDVEAVDPANKVFLRGFRIFQAVMDDLKAKGMNGAQKVLVSGCSSGGLASIILCDHVRDRFPSSTKVKCLADAGFFIDVKDVSGADHIRTFFQQVATLHQSTKILPAACTAKMGSLCFFPQNLLPYVRTPVFLINAAYDSWQVKNSLAAGASDPRGIWKTCKLNILKCNANQLDFLQTFRNQMLAALKGFQSTSGGGMYINSCYAHCQAGVQDTYMSPDSPKLNGKSIAAAVGEWYNDMAPVKLVDCPYPCDKTCHNRAFDGDNISTDEEDL